DYLKNRAFLAVSVILYAIISVFYIDFILFFPLILYDVFPKKQWALYIFLTVALVYNIQRLSQTMDIVLFILIGLSWLLKRNVLLMEKLHHEYTKLRDTTREKALQLEFKNKDLMEKQDYEVNLATLNERNRIAREIHDNVGHMLTRSILQVGALMSIYKEEPLRTSLVDIKETLSGAMDSIRSSVHDLHDESIDCYALIQELINHFDYCETSLDYDVHHHLPKKLRYAFIAIIKEALSNVVKHSNASKITIMIREHPALYQLMIEDNGTVKKTSKEGLGLENMADRVEALGGSINIKQENGFCIFISIPKEEKA
ncbi:MAG: sensor histidine kinase, partial [Eubacterium sp.]